MKIYSQKRPEFQHLAQLVEGSSIAMLTHLDADGMLVSRPMTALEFDSDGVIWFFADRNSAGSHDLQVVNLSFADAQRSIYVSMSGHGELTSDIEHIRRLWTPYAKPWFPQGPETPNLALLKFTPEAAETWDSPHSKAVRVLAMAASIFAAKPVGLGKHERISELPGSSKAS
jgi:general stress protein 26